jgi:hypothetical protein
LKELKAKADAVHIAALNLSSTLGVFHGINNSLEAGALGGPEIRAINVIQSDLLHLLVIRVCALCASVQNRPDDASIQGLVNALEDIGTREKLIEADERWRAAIGARAEMCGLDSLPVGRRSGNEVGTVSINLLRQTVVTS